MSYRFRKAPKVLFVECDYHSFLINSAKLIIVFQIHKFVNQIE